jgi:hypothetical protein
MPKLTPEQRAELERQLADDDDGDDFEFHYGEGDRTISLPWSQRHALADFGFKGSPKAPAKPGAQGDGGKGDGKPAPVSVFGPRQRRTSGGTS